MLQNCSPGQGRAGQGRAGQGRDRAGTGQGRAITTTCVCEASKTGVSCNSFTNVKLVQCWCIIGVILT